MPTVPTNAEAASCPALGMQQLIRRDQQALACPYPIFASLRSEAPVSYCEELGAWVVLSHADVRAVLHDNEHFSSRMPTGPRARGAQLAAALRALATEPEMAPLLAALAGSGSGAQVLLNADPPLHRRQRVAVNGAFRPSRLRALEPVIAAVANRLLAALVADTGNDPGPGAGQSVDIVSSFAVGLPLQLIAYALGVADEDLATFKRWSDDLVMPIGNDSPTVDQVRDHVRSTVDFADYFWTLALQRRQQPSSDLISDVANARIDGELLSRAEVLGMLQQFLVAGNETTTKLVTNIVLQLASDPGLQQRVRAQRSLIDGLVEEALRFEAPVSGLFRQVVREVSVGGTVLPVGAHLWVLYAAANRDGAFFTDPDRFDADRANAAEHLSFGHGEHHCIGAGLARAEARIGIGALLDQLQDIRLAEDNEFTYADTFVLRGLTSLRITFTRSAPADPEGASR